MNGFGLVYLVRELSFPRRVYAMKVISINAIESE
jgi:hypothetical protein